MIPGASPTLLDRLASKICPAGPATPCAVWVGAYNIDGRRMGRVNRGRRPVIKLGSRYSLVYVAPLLLALSEDGDLRPVEPETGERLEALHSCPAPWHGVYSCVDLRCLRWGTRTENEADKRLRDHEVDPIPF